VLGSKFSQILQIAIYTDNSVLECLDTEFKGNNINIPSAAIESFNSPLLNISTSNFS
jgi:hypothetical protein